MMRKWYKFIFLAYNEVKVSYIRYLAISLILSLIIAVGISIVTASINIPSSFKKGIDSVFNYYEFTIKEYNLNDIESLRNNGVTVEYKDNEFTKNTYVKNVEQKVIFVDYQEDPTIINNQQGSVMFFENEYNFIYSTLHQFAYYDSGNNLKRFLVDGSLWTYQDNFPDINGYYPIFLSTVIAEYLGVSEGDYVHFFTEDSPYAIMLRVKGVYDRLMYSSTLPLYIVPLNAVLLLTDNSIGDISLTIDSKIMYRYSNRLNRLDNLVVDKENILSIILGIKIITISFWTLSVIVIIAGLFILFNQFAMMLTDRTHYIGMLKAVGLNGNDIKYIYQIIIQAILLFSVIIGTFIAILLNNQIVEIIQRITMLIANMRLLWYVPIILFFCLSLMMLPVMYYLQRRIDDITVNDLLKEES